MAVSRMSKVQIYAHNSLKSKIVKHLQSLDIIQIINVQEALEGDDSQGSEVEESETARLLEKDLSSLEFAIDYLKDYDQTEGGGFLSGGKLLFSPQEYKKILDEERYKKWHKITSRCREVSDEKTRLDSRIDRLQSESEDLSLWSNLDIVIEEISDTENVAVRAGTLPNAFYPEMLNEISESEIDVEFDVVSKDQDLTYILAVFLKENEEAISSILNQYSFTVVTFPRSEGKISNIIGELDRKIGEIKSQKEDLERESLELSTDRTKLMAVYDHLSDLLVQEQAKSSFLNTEHTFMIEGWVRESDLNSLQNSIPENWGAIDIQAVEPDADEEPPVDLKNSSIIEPFQMVTNLYGKPKYRELDPTPLLAPFFAFFLGICITDAGYGIFLSIVATIAFLKIRKSIIGKGTKQLVGLLIIGGLTTIVAGVLTDGFFGRSLPAPFSKLALISPVTNPKDQATFLGVALLLGLFHVWVGFAIKFYVSLRDKNMKSAFRADLPWVIITPAAFLPLILSWFLGIPVSWTASLVIMAICSVWIIALSDLEGQSVGAKIGNGFFNWYGIASAFGDVLSYSRLFALGLATGIIGQVVNTIVFDMIWGIGVIGPILGVVVLVGGHIFNLVINLLGGFIHTARLQFVEYFTKFYEGGGETFEPLAKNPTYTAVMEVVSIG